MGRTDTALGAEEFFDALESMLSRFQSSQRKLLRDAKLTPLHFFVIRWLSQDRHANASDLARRLGIRPQTMTPIIDALEKGGLLTRVPSPVDRRAVLLVLTPKGVRQVRAVRTAQVRVVREALEGQPAGVAPAAVRALLAIRDSLPDR